MTVLSKATARKRSRWKKRLLLLLVLVLVLVLAAVAGATTLYYYDRSQADRIAAGVTVAGVQIGGMTPATARRTLARRLLPHYQRPLEFWSGRWRFVLRPSAVGLRLAIWKSVASALEETRGGGFVDRVYRELRGRPLDLHLAVRARYSDEAVASFVRRVGRTIAVEPRDARFVASVWSPQIIPSHDGLALLGPRLHRMIVGRLLNPQRRRHIVLPTRVLAPDQTTREVATAYRYYLTVSRGERRLRFFEDLTLRKTFTIAVGRIGLETPAGLYRIEDKQVNPSWHVPMSSWAGDLAGRVIPPGPDDPLKARWMGFYDGAGIHGTDDLSSLGSAASHGCIRMSIPDVIELYDLVPLHTPILIA
jgi:lipoprotein-anchoring transpeptidase ErfK/SrfK